MNDDITPARRSPLAPWHAVAASRTVDAAAPVWLRDVSLRARFGCKGGAAPDWLAGLGVAVPPRFNHFDERDGLLVARLAATEFLLEADRREHPLLQSAARTLEQRLAAGGAGVYPVPRHDAALALGGALARDLLAQTCSVNFEPMAARAEAAAGPLAMTSMAGVSVLVVPQARSGAVVYRIWCDPTYAPYLWRTLVGIAEELGGGATP